MSSPFAGGIVKRNEIQDNWLALFIMHGNRRLLLKIKLKNIFLTQYCMWTPFNYFSAISIYYSSTSRDRVLKEDSGHPLVTAPNTYLNSFARLKDMTYRETNYIWS